MASDGGLRPMFAAKLPRIHWTSIENAFVANGVPDANYCLDGVEGWVEFKKTEGWRVGLRPEQVGWISRRVRSGGNVFVATRRKNEDRGFDELYIHAGQHAVVLKAEGLRAARPLFIGEGGPTGWDWEKVSRILLLKM